MSTFQFGIYINTFRLLTRYLAPLNYYFEVEFAGWLQCLVLGSTCHYEVMCSVAMAEERTILVWADVGYVLPSAVKSL